MIGFIGTVKEFKDAMTLYLLKKGVEKERIEEIPFQFTVNKFDGIDFIDKEGEGAFNFNALPVENKQPVKIKEIREVYNNLTKNLREQ